MSTTSPIDRPPDLEAFYRRIEPMSLLPGWRRPELSIWPEPKQNFLANAWSWEECRLALLRACSVVDTDQAERRNLIMVNPLQGNSYATLRTMVAAYQMMKPGERARSHRHTPHALRLILEGEHSFTIVDGVRLNMRPGDVVLTPGGSWHGHGIDPGGDKPGAWLDVLDRPLVLLLEPLFQDNHPDGFEIAAELGARHPFLFPWEGTQERLQHASDLDGIFDARIELGSPALPTLCLHMQRLGARTQTSGTRSTANRLFCAVSGEGEAVIDGSTLAWRKGDVFVVPCWRSVRHIGGEGDSVLFSVSDEPLQRACGYFNFRRE